MIDYRFATFAQLSNVELYDVMALREEVLVLEQKCTVADLDGLDKNAIHVSVFSDGALFAVARILPPDIYKKGVVSFGRLVIKKAYRGQGYGRALMEMILHYIQEHYSNYPIEFSAQQYLQKFYENFGFKRIGAVYDEGGIPHIKMRNISFAFQRVNDPSC